MLNKHTVKCLPPSFPLTGDELGDRVTAIVAASKGGEEMTGVVPLHA